MEKTGITKGRDPYWDIVRGIAMLLVILGHSIHTALGVEDPGSRIIYTFHMPLFMLISGWFFPATLRHPTWKIVKDKFLLLVLPCIICGTIDYLLDHPSGIDAKTHLIKWYGRMLNSLWFFQALFICSMVMLIAERCFKKHSLWFCLFLFLLSFIIPDFFRSYQAKALFPFFVLGFCMKKFDLISWYRKHRWIIFFSTLAIFLLMFPLFTYKNGTFYALHFYIFSGIDTPRTILFWNLYRIPIGVAGCILILDIVRIFSLRLDKTVPARVLDKIGRHTYGIYIFSMYIWIIYINTMQNFFPIRNNYVYIIFLTGILLLLSYPLGVLLERCIAALKHK